MVRVPIDAASAKVRTGGPIDDPADLGLPVWAGTLPLETVVGPVVPDPALGAGIEVPPYLAAASRPAATR